MSLRSLILQGEHERLDFKNAISNAFKIAKTLVAFANNKGGVLLIGVADDGSVRGVKDEEEEKYMINRAAHRHCKPVIDPIFEEMYLDDKLVLKVTIAESDTKPHYAEDENGKWWAYIRIKDKSVLASKIILDVLKNAHKEVVWSYTEYEEMLFAHLRTHPTVTLKEFSRLARLPHKKSQKILSALIITGAVKVHTSEKEEFFTL